MLTFFAAEICSSGDGATDFILNIDFVFELFVCAEVVAIAASGTLSLVFGVANGAGVNVNVIAGASTVFGLAIGSSIFLVSIVGAFGAGNAFMGNTMSAFFTINWTFGKSIGSGGISCSCNLLPFRCFGKIFFRILLTCLLLGVDL